jgi:hypothetical protein
LFFHAATPRFVIRTLYFERQYRERFGQGAGVLSNAAFLEPFSGFDKAHLDLPPESKELRRIISIRSM